MSKDTSIIILAAGFGTRMKSSKAKVLHELCGIPMIVHILKSAYEVSDDVAVVLSHQLEEISAVIKKLYPKTKIYRQDITNYPGTAGALRDIEFSGKKTLVICGDMPLITAKEISSLAKEDGDIALSVFKAKEPSNYGRVVMSGSAIKKIVEQKDASDEERKIELVNGGCYAFKTDVLKRLLPLISNNNNQKEYYLTDTIELATKNGLVCKAVIVDELNFMGINDKFSLSVAEEILGNRIKKELMLNGVKFRLPATTYIDARAKFSGECVVEENVTIIGKCELDNVTIKSGTIIENSKISNSKIGPLAHIRPNCDIKNSAIGNFVELKNAKLNGVKAGHLSYLGDCFIDEGTNVGCGVITCNYDGKAKYQTKVGKNVFIGSDSQLIAPVTVEDDVIIAAGSTITSDITKGSLAISRVKQTNKEGFFYKFFKAKEC